MSEISKSKLKKTFVKSVNEAVGRKTRFRVESDDFDSIAPGLIMEYGWVERRGSTPEKPVFYDDRLGVRLLDGSTYCVMVKAKYDREWGCDVLIPTGVRVMK